MSGPNAHFKSDQSLESLINDPVLIHDRFSLFCGFIYDVYVRELLEIFDKIFDLMNISKLLDTLSAFFCFIVG